MSDTPTIGVVIGTHARLDYLAEQIEAIRRQTIRPAAIHVWHDGPQPPPDCDKSVIVAGSRRRQGVWQRFYYAASLPTDFVCIFDDDTIPGPRWLENCFRTHNRTGGLVGAAGVRFPAGDRSQRPKFGWPRPNTRIGEVDIIGHSWFLPRRWLAYFVLEPRMPGCPATVGEDYHLSFSLQKHLDVRSYACPHPPAERDLWGSLKGRAYGNDRHALWARPAENTKKLAIHNHYRACGWRLVQTPPPSVSS